MQPVPTGEVAGLGAAQQFAAGMSAALAGQLGHTGQFVELLRGQGVDGTVVAAAEEAQRASDTAAAAWVRADRVLTAHGQVGEAYAANPGAGSKEFLMDDQHTASPATAAGSAPAVSPAQPSPKVKDPVKVGSKIVLRDGETFAGSATTRSDEEGNLVLAAAVDTSDGRVVHVGVPVFEEDKGHWRGAHAPAKATKVDEEEGYTYSVDTSADRTVVLNAADAVQLPQQVEEIITRATEVNQQYRQLAKESDRLYAERQRLECKRFGDSADADQQLRLDSSETSHKKYQQHRRDYIDDCVSRLGPDDRTRYDQVQRQIDEAGKDLFEPDREQQAAEVCGLSVNEYHELVELKKRPHHSRTRAENERREELEPSYRRPPLLAEQAAIVHGLALDEYRELEALDKVGRPHIAFGGRPAGRTPQQQARYEELRSAPGGVVGGTPKQTGRLRDKFETYQSAHHADKLDWTAERQQRAELETRAKPLNEADAARLRQVIAEDDDLSTRLEALGGETTARVEVSGCNGATLVVEAVQREEEGGVDYMVDCRSAAADEDTPQHEAYRTNAGGARKVAKVIAGLAAPPS